MDPIKDALSQALAPLLEVPADQVAKTLGRPPRPELGEFALPVFRWAKPRGMKPPELAGELAGKAAESPLVETATAQGPYVNFKLAPAEMGRLAAAPVLADPTRVAQAPARGERILIDFSSPNIAKPFHIGHLTTTVLGNSLVRILRRRGYEVVGINHLGDWGTQFGKSAVAWRRWGSEEELAAAGEAGTGVRYLVSLYVKFHEEAENEPGLDDEAREWFRKLEEGDEEHRALWQRFVDVSLKEIERVYQRLNVSFEHYTGESFYEDKIPDAIERLKAAGILEVSDGAEIVDLGEKKTPFLVRKSDGATLYGTRDLAAAFYRLAEFDPVNILYVVGAPQKLHFEQLFGVLGKLDPALPAKFEHVWFGHTRFKNRAIKTRAGDVVYLEDVLGEAKELVAERVQANLAERGDYLEADCEELSWKLATSALVFGNLKSDRIKDQIFDWETAFDFQGDTGPGVQYSHAQCRSILRRAGGIAGDPDWSTLEVDQERQLLGLLSRFPAAVSAAADTRKPNHITGYLCELRALINSYLRNEELPRIIQLEAGPLRDTRLALIQAAAEVLKTGLYLLGIEAVDQM